MKKTIRRILSIFVCLVSACAPVKAESITAIPSSGTPMSLPATLTPSPRPVFTATAPPTLTPAPTSTPTITPTLDPIRHTPPTLMLHRPNLQFDSLAFLKEFVTILKQNDMKVVTYRNLYKHPELTATEPGRLFIITIDDISLAYPMDPHVVEMIEVLREADYPAVLGVVTATDYPYPETIARLKKLSRAGWEIASHTDTHANLLELETASPRLVHAEVSTSLDKIEKAIGIRPMTLVLPDGQMVNSMNSLANMDLHWIVGINGGITYDSRKSMIYVGREGPARNAEYTYKIMKMRFGF